jgi:hypothetical protein
MISNFRRVSPEWEDQHYPVPSLDEESEMTTIPTVALKLCEYDKSRKVLKLASEYFGMPRTFFVKSHHTGKEVRFVTVGPEDRLFSQDGWDGEMQIYRPVGNVPGVDHMVIYHAW